MAGGASENQERSASCLAVSTTGSLEGAWFIATGDLSQTKVVTLSFGVSLLTLPVRLGNLSCQSRDGGVLLCFACEARPNPFGCRQNHRVLEPREQ